MDKTPFACVVGYSTITLNEKNTIVGINFLGVDGNSLSIQDAIPYVDGMVKGNAAAAADQIQIRNETGGYNIYYMSNGKNAKGTTVAGLDGKWAAGGKYVPTTDTVSAGTAFWYIRNGWTGESAPLNLTVAGSVSMLAESDKAIVQQYSHIANPYPTDLALNDGIPFVEGMTKGNAAAAADQIQIQNGAGGYNIYYMSNGKNAKGTAVAGLEGKWAAGGKYVPTTDAIPAGKGAWFCRKGSENFTIKIARPFAVAE